VREGAFGDEVVHAAVDVLGDDGVPLPDLVEFAGVGEEEVGDGLGPVFEQRVEDLLEGGKLVGGELFGYDRLSPSLLEADT